MSHFTVLVVAKDETELKQKMIPFYEYGCSSDYDELVKPHLQWENIEDEYRSQYETEFCENVLMPDGRALLTWDDEFRVEGHYGFGTGTHKVPEHLQRIQVMHKDRFATFDEYMSEWCGYEKMDRGWGYWHNPNAKWDGYAIGGRWTNLLIFKAGGMGDNARIENVDFQAMRNKRALNEAQAWDKAAKVLKRVDKTVEQWLKLDRDSRNELAAIINKEIDDRKHLWSLWDLQPLAETRVEHIEVARNLASTFAYIDKTGAWHEKGSMGWWAIVTDKNDTYAIDFWNSIDDLAPELNVYVVDCHI